MRYDLKKVKELRKSATFTLLICLLVATLIAIEFDYLPLFVFGPGLIILGGYAIYTLFEIVGCKEGMLQIEDASEYVVINNLRGKEIRRIKKSDIDSISCYSDKDDEYVLGIITKEKVKQSFFERFLTTFIQKKYNGYSVVVYGDVSELDSLEVVKSAKVDTDESLEFKCLCLAVLTGIFTASYISLLDIKMLYVVAAFLAFAVCCVVVCSIGMSLSGITSTLMGLTIGWYIAIGVGLSKEIEITDKLSVNAMRIAIYVGGIVLIVLLSHVMTQVYKSIKRQKAAT